MNQKYFPIIDNGHGKLTFGKRSPILPDGRQFLEYEFNLAVAVKLSDMLEDAGILAAYTNKNPEDKDNWLNGRVEAANKAAAQARKDGMIPYFVSIHSNAAPADSDGWSTARGVETWYHRDSFKGLQLAEVFQRHIVTATGLKDRGLKFHASGSPFKVLKDTICPAILTENGFFNNLEEVEYLLTEKAEWDVAEAHFCAIQEIELNGLK